MISACLLSVVIIGGYQDIAPPGFLFPVAETRAADSSPQFHKGAQSSGYRPVHLQPAPQVKPAPVSHIHYTTRKFTVKR